MSDHGEDVSDAQKNLMDAFGSMSPGTRRRTLSMLAELQGATGGVRLSTADGDTTISPGTQVIVENKPSFHRKIRNFSGKVPPANGEASYKQWRISALQVLKDESLSEGEKKNYLLHSLCGEAYEDIGDILRRYGHTAAEIYGRLHHIYGEKKDQQDMLVEFFSTDQKEGEKPSEYLRRLFRLLVEMEEEGVVDRTETMIHLNKQFRRGYRDQTFLNSLPQEVPVHYDEFLVNVRRQEINLDGKRERFENGSKQNGESSSEKKYKAKLHQVDATVPLEKTVKDLQELVVSMHQQMKSSQKPDVRSKDNGHRNTHRPANQNYRRTQRRFFCYNCGKDGHMKISCTEEKNEALVFRRLNQEN